MSLENQSWEDEETMDSLRARVLELEALVGTIRSIVGAEARNVSDIGVEQHSREIAEAVQEMQSKAHDSEMEAKTFRIAEEEVVAILEKMDLVIPYVLATIDPRGAPRIDNLREERDWYPVHCGRGDCSTRQLEDLHREIRNIIDCGGDDGKG